MQRGVIYFLLGDRHAVVTALSIRSLREYWDGPLLLFWGDEKGKATLERVAEAIDGMGETTIRRCPLKKCRRHVGYSTKPLLPRYSPFDATIQLDGDTLVTGEFGDLWPRNEEELVLTQFVNWVTTGKRISGRIRKWSGVAADLVERQFEKSYPAINTGVLGYGRYNETAMLRWDEVCDLRRGTFINDELAMQLLSLESNTRVIDCRWNYSPLHGTKIDLPGKVRIQHFHGKKHCKPAAWKLWGPHFLRAITTNWAGMADWAPAGDKRLRSHLESIGANTQKPLSSKINQAAIVFELMRMIEQQLGK